MNNPWKNCDLDLYESHMAFETVGQLQVLSNIMKSQFFDYSSNHSSNHSSDSIDTVAIWGIAGGNGLEHISSNDFLKVYGIDINQNYLNQVKDRYSNLENILSLEAIDLNDLSVNLIEVDLVIANLIVEYLGILNFTKQIEKSNPSNVSVVIQKDDFSSISKKSISNFNNSNFVSESPYIEKLEDIGKFGKSIDENDLIESLEKIDYFNILKKEYDLPNSKKFVRLDFKK